jgi:hypothetical protein
MAPNYCCVKNCNSKSCDSGVVLFSFPKEFNDKWLEVVNRDDWKPKPNSKICSKHFSPCSIRRKRLIPGAMPCRGEILHSVHQGMCFFYLESYKSKSNNVK